MDDEEDPHWEAEAEAADAEEKRAEAWERIATCLDKVRKLRALNVRTLQRGTRLVVMFFEEDDDPLATGPVEFTILDPASCKVLVKNERHFVEPTEATLLGCEHFTSPPLKRVFQDGKLELFWWLNCEAAGKTFDRDSIPHTIKRIVVILPSGTKFDIWND